MKSHPMNPMKASILAIVALTASGCDDVQKHPLLPPVSASPSGEKEPAPEDSQQKRNEDDAGVEDSDDASRTQTAEPSANADVEMTREKRVSNATNENHPADIRNVRLITHDGVITLQGQVRSERERRTIGSFARDLGADQVDNQLVIVRDASPAQHAPSDGLHP